MYNNSNEIDTLNCTLNLSATDAAELDKLNNADLLNDYNLNQLNLTFQLENSDHVDATTMLSLEDRACSSNNSVQTHETEPTVSNQTNVCVSKPNKRALRRNTPQVSNSTENTDTTQLTTLPDSSTAVKEEPVVIIDDKDNCSLIDLTKENDDVMILSVENSSNTTNFRNRQRTVRTSRRLQSVLNNNNVPTTSASAIVIDSVTVNDVNNMNDMDIIQEVLSNDSNKTNRPCVDITYHICSRSDPRNIFMQNNQFVRQSRVNRFSLNSTIVIDDERTEQIAEAAFMLPAPIQPQINANLDLPNSSNVLTDAQVLSVPTHSPKRLKTDKSNKKDHQKNTQSKSSSLTASGGSSNSIHCPICLETLDEIKSHNKRLKSTFCGHILCNLCLDATFKSSGDGFGSSKSIHCPTCRTKLTKTKIHDLFL